MSHLPFIHLLPAVIYKYLMKAVGEPEGVIREMLDIKKCATSVELFEKLGKISLHLQKTLPLCLRFVDFTG